MRRRRSGCSRRPADRRPCRRGRRSSGSTRATSAMSQRLSRIALPVSGVSRRASSSWSRSMRPATRSRSAARSPVGVRGQSVVSKARRAAAMAAWTWSSVATSTSVTIVPSDGLTTRAARPVAGRDPLAIDEQAGTHLGCIGVSGRIAEDARPPGPGQRHVAGGARHRAASRSNASRSSRDDGSTRPASAPRASCGDVRDGRARTAGRRRPGARLGRSPRSGRSGGSADAGGRRGDPVGRGRSSATRTCTRSSVSRDSGMFSPRAATQRPAASSTGTASAPASTNSSPRLIAQPWRRVSSTTAARTAGIRDGRRRVGGQRAGEIRGQLGRTHRGEEDLAGGGRVEPGPLAGPGERADLLRCRRSCR